MLDQMRARNNQIALDTSVNKATKTSSGYPFNNDESMLKSMMSFQDAEGDPVETDYAESQIDPELEGIFYDALEEA